MTKLGCLALVALVASAPARASDDAAADEAAAAAEAASAADDERANDDGGDDTDDGPSPLWTALAGTGGAAAGLVGSTAVIFGGAAVLLYVVQPAVGPQVWQETQASSMSALVCLSPILCSGAGAFLATLPFLEVWASGIVGLASGCGVPLGGGLGFVAGGIVGVFAALAALVVSGGGDRGLETAGLTWAFTLLGGLFLGGIAGSLVGAAASSATLAALEE